jgi:hypothetical protein
MAKKKKVRFSHKYTRYEREIAYQIHKVEAKMYGQRQRYLDLDVKRTNLIWMLNGKYKNGDL